MATTDWNLRSRAHACMKCAAPFAAGGAVRTAVLPFGAPLVAELFAEKLAEEAAAAAAGAAPKPHPDYVRLDFCEDCWKAMPPGTPWISAWKSVYEPPPAEPADPVKKADHESLLRSLLEGPEPQNWLPEIYLLAILLERRRILVERRVASAPDGTRVHIYEHRRSGDILLVADPDFTADRIPETQARIEKLLGIERPAPAAAPPAPLRVGLLGGSFDPVHEGHLALAREAMRVAGLDRVLFAPAADSPFKAGRMRASAADREAMVKLAIEGEPRFGLCRADLERGGISYSVDLVRDVKASLPPDAELFFVLGADALAGLHGWRDAGELVRLCRFLSFGRRGTSVDPATLGFDPGTSARLAADFHPDFDSPVSSSDIRRRLAAGEPADGLLPPAVADYAVSRGLYRTPDGPPPGDAPADPPDGTC